MSEEYLPLTDEERTFRVEGARQSVGMPGSAGMLRWDATVCQLEAGLAAVTAERDVEWNARGVAQAALAKMTEERDAYRAFFDAWLNEKPLEREIAFYQGAYGFKRRLAFVAALEIIAALPFSQPSGNSGGFAAAAGILADTWNGEPAEVTIRRLREYGIARDGTPAPESTKTIAETRMREPNAIDAEEET